MFIIAIATLVGLLSACGQGDSAAKSAATAPVAGTPTPAAEGAPTDPGDSRDK